MSTSTLLALGLRGWRPGDDDRDAIEPAPAALLQLRELIAHATALGRVSILLYDQPEEVIAWARDGGTVKHYDIATKWQHEQITRHVGNVSVAVIVKEKP